jgi:hypothetical protein
MKKRSKSNLVPAPTPKSRIMGADERRVYLSIREYFSVPGELIFADLVQGLATYSDFDGMGLA